MRAIFLGVVTGEGVSKAGKDYQFSQIRVLRPAKGFKSDKAEFQSTGMREAVCSCSEAFYKEAALIKVNPLALQEFEFVVSNEFNDFDKLEAVVTGFKK